MMERLTARAEADAEARRRTIVARLVEAAVAEVPRDVTVEADERGIVLTGRRLTVRTMRDARLRGFAALAGRGR